ncbi:MAG: hypothetical protein ACOYEV_15480 [Candidatus Nanopelagicales bacterium]
MGLSVVAALAAEEAAEPSRLPALINGVGVFVVLLLLLFVVTRFDPDR